MLGVSQGQKCTVTGGVKHACSSRVSLLFLMDFFYFFLYDSFRRFLTVFNLYVLNPFRFAVTRPWLKTIFVLPEITE